MPPKQWKPKVFVPAKPKSKDPMVLPHPFRVWILGSSGTGKSNFAFNIIQYLQPFNQLYFFGNSLNNPTIDKFREICDQMAGEDPDYKFFFTSDIEEFPTCSELAEEPGHKVAIFDDFSSLRNSEISKISTFAEQSRGANCSCIFISHQYSSSSAGSPAQMKIRDNCQWFVLFGGLKQLTVKMLAREYLDPIDPDVFYQYYRATTEGKTGNFVIVDRDTPYQNLKVRRNPDQPEGNLVLRLSEEAARSTRRPRLATIPEFPDDY